MVREKIFRRLALLSLLALSIASCVNIPAETTLSSSPAVSETAQPVPTSTGVPTSTPVQSAPVPDLSAYAFPESIDAAQRYLFYLHGKIIEDQGIPAVSPDFGEYEYGAILARLSEYGFVVISEQRPKDTDGVIYANRVVEQITSLLAAGVPAENITVIGASKGAGITVFVSHFLKNEDINYVIMAICHADEVKYLIQNQIGLYGNILSIYDASDEFAGSCQELFSASEGRGLSETDEIVLHVGSGHGILYKPLDEWILPAVQWAGKP